MKSHLIINALKFAEFSDHFLHQPQKYVWENFNLCKLLSKFTILADISTKVNFFSVVSKETSKLSNFPDLAFI